MPRGCRCILVAFVGWLSLAASEPKRASGNPSNTTDHEVAKALNNLAVAIDHNSKPTAHDEPCDKGENKRRSDLCAQWKAADAAKQAADVALWIGIIGTLIGGLTLWAAIKAARWAKKAAEETERTADLAAATSAADLRPYLFIEKLVMDREERVFRPEIIFRNFGKLPARAITVKTDAFFTMDPVNLRPNVLHAPVIAFPVCAPGHTRRRFESVLLNEEEVKAFEAGFGYIVVRVRYRYKGGPRKGGYAERADYVYSSLSIKSGHFYLLTWDARQRAHEERTLMFDFMNEGDEGYLDDDGEEPKPDPDRAA